MGREQSTRARILRESLALFNERGLSKTTTAEIAKAAEVREGNLYYYFKKKEDLIIALFGIFEEALMRVAQQRLGPLDEPESYARYQRSWFDLMWDHRWVYRDGAALFAVAPSLRERVQPINAIGQANVRRVLEAMVEHGVMDAAPEQLDKLVVSVWIVSSHWLDYLRASGGVVVVRPEHVEWGYAQLQSLYAPYLTERGAPLLRLSGRPEPIPV